MKDQEDQKFEKEQSSFSSSTKIALIRDQANFYKFKQSFSAIPQTRVNQTQSYISKKSFTEYHQPLQKRKRFKPQDSVGLQDQGEQVSQEDKSLHEVLKNPIRIAELKSGFSIAQEGVSKIMQADQLSQQQARPLEPQVLSQQQLTQRHREVPVVGIDLSQILQENERKRSSINQDMSASPIQARRELENPELIHEQYVIGQKISDPTNASPLSDLDTQAMIQSRSDQQIPQMMPRIQRQEEQRSEDQSPGTPQGGDSLDWKDLKFDSEQHDFVAPHHIERPSLQQLHETYQKGTHPDVKQDQSSSLQIPPEQMRETRPEQRLQSEEEMIAEKGQEFQQLQKQKDQLPQTMSGSDQIGQLQQELLLRPFTLRNFDQEAARELKDFDISRHPAEEARSQPPLLSTEYHPLSEDQRWWKKLESPQEKQSTSPKDLRLTSEWTLVDKMKYALYNKVYEKFAEEQRDVRSDSDLEDEFDEEIEREQEQKQRQTVGDFEKQMLQNQQDQEEEENLVEEAKNVQPLQEKEQFFDVRKRVRHQKGEELIRRFEEAIKRKIQEIQELEKGYEREEQRGRRKVSGEENSHHRSESPERVLEATSELRSNKHRAFKPIPQTRQMMEPSQDIDQNKVHRQKLEREAIGKTLSAQTQPTSQKFQVPQDEEYKGRFSQEQSQQREKQLFSEKEFDMKHGDRQQQTMKPGFNERNGWIYQENREDINDGFAEGDLECLFNEDIFQEEQSYDQIATSQEQMKQQKDLVKHQVPQFYNERRGTWEQQILKEGYACENGWCYQADRTQINDGFQEGDLSRLFDESYCLDHIPVRQQKGIQQRLQSYERKPREKKQHISEANLYNERRGTRWQQLPKPGYVCAKSWCYQVDRSKINDGFEEGDLEWLFDQSQVVERIPRHSQQKRNAARRLKKIYIDGLLRRQMQAWRDKQQQERQVQYRRKDEVRQERQQREEQYREVFGLKREIIRANKNVNPRFGDWLQQQEKPGYQCENGWCYQVDRTQINDGFEEGDLAKLFDESCVVESIKVIPQVGCEKRADQMKRADERRKEMQPRSKNTPKFYDFKHGTIEQQTGKYGYARQNGWWYQVDRYSINDGFQEGDLSSLFEESTDSETLKLPQEVEHRHKRAHGKPDEDWDIHIQDKVFHMSPKKLKEQHLIDEKHGDWIQQQMKEGWENSHGWCYQKDRSHLDEEIQSGDLDSLFDEEFEGEANKDRLEAKQKEKREEVSVNNKGITSLDKKPETIKYVPNELDYQEQLRALQLKRKTKNKRGKKQKKLRDQNLDQECYREHTSIGDLFGDPYNLSHKTLATSEDHLIIIPEVRLDKVFNKLNPGRSCKPSLEERQAQSQRDKALALEKKLSVQNEAIQSSTQKFQERLERAVLNNMLLSREQELKQAGYILDSKGQLRKKPWKTENQKKKYKRKIKQEQRDQEERERDQQMWRSLDKLQLSGNGEEASNMQASPEQSQSQSQQQRESIIEKLKKKFSGATIQKRMKLTR